MPETLTIVFSGLMILHEDKANQMMEIGILQEETHIPRILTIRNGVLADISDLRLKPQLGDTQHRAWRLEVTNPVQQGISLYTDGNKFERQTHEDDKDFRWIMDFESDEFYNKDLTGQMLTKKLMPVLQIPNGEFYTRLKSPSLARSKDAGAVAPFGAVAAFTGCDIQVEGGSVKLKVADTDDDLFTFKTEESSLANTIFEITNTPPDVLPVLGHVHGGHQHSDHFQFYYDLFSPQNMPSPKFGFEALADDSPAPDPRLCGKGIVGKRTDPL